MISNLIGFSQKGHVAQCMHALNVYSPACVILGRKGKTPMTGKFTILDERYEEFDSKKGRQKVRRLALIDTDKPALIVGIDYEPKGDDATKLPEGTVVGKSITLGVRNLRATFGGRFLLEGALLGVNGGTPVGK